MSKKTFFFSKMKHIVNIEKYFSAFFFITKRCHCHNWPKCLSVFSIEFINNYIFFWGRKVSKVKLLFWHRVTRSVWPPIAQLSQGSDFSESPGRKFRPGTQVGADPTWKSRRPSDPQNFLEKTLFFM